MKNLILLIAFTLAGTAAALAVTGCGKTERRARSEPLSGIRPERRHTMRLVMGKIGRHYQMLAVAVDKGNFLEAAGHADAIAALGSYLAPGRDPDMPATYITRLAPFDETARELAAAARLGKAREATLLLDEIRAACRSCHGEFRVELEAPYRELGWTKAED